MSIIARKPEGGDFDFTPVPSGTHQAICTIVADIGWQEVVYSGQAKLQHKVVLRFEIPQLRTTWTVDDKEHEGPMVISRKYTLSLHEKADLRKDLESWRGRKFTEEQLESFDVLSVLGVPCLLGVVHSHDEKKNRTYANIGSIMGFPPGMPQIPKAEGELIGFSWGELHKLDKLPKSMQNAINAAKADPNTQPMTGQGYAPEAASQSMLPGEAEHYSSDPSDDLPF